MMKALLIAAMVLSFMGARPIEPPEPCPNPEPAFGAMASTLYSDCLEKLEWWLWNGCWELIGHGEEWTHWCDCAEVDWCEEEPGLERPERPRPANLQLR